MNLDQCQSSILNRYTSRSSIPLLAYTLFRRASPVKVQVVYKESRRYTEHRWINKEYTGVSGTTTVSAARPAAVYMSSPQVAAQCFRLYRCCKRDEVRRGRIHLRSHGLSPSTSFLAQLHTEKRCYRVTHLLKQSSMPLSDDGGASGIRA